MIKQNATASVDNRTSQIPRFYPAVIAGIYCVAVLLRVFRYLSAGLSAENCLIGSTAEEFLRGNFPLFLLGKNHMGTYDALLSAPLIYLFGPSSYILNLWPPLFSMGVMIIMHRVLKRFAGPWGVAVGLMSMAVPPAFWMFYCGYAQTHYSLGVLLSAVLILLTVELWDRPRWTAGRAFGWGLAAGAMLYTHPQTIGVFLACTLLLLFGAWKRIRPLNLSAFFFGGVVGGLPLAYYLLTAHSSYGQQVNVYGWHYFPPHVQGLFSNALPIILGFSTPAVGGTVTPDSLMFIVYLVMLAILAAGLTGLIVKGVKGNPGSSLLFPLIFAAYFAILVFSIYGDALSSFNQAYLLSLYLVLPVCLSLAMTWMIRHARPAAMLLPVLIIFISVTGYCSYSHLGRPFFGSPARQYNLDAMHRGQAQVLRQTGIKTMYAQDSWRLGYYTNGDPLVVHNWKARKPMDGHMVDASPDPLYYGVNLEESARLLGLPYNNGVVASRKSYWGFGQPDKGGLLQRESWRASATDGADLGCFLSDGDLSTGFSTVKAARAGQGFVLDLGQEQTLSGIALIPMEHEQVPAGLKIEASTDGKTYSVLRQAANYWGPFYMSGPHAFMRTVHIRVESYWPAKPVRYLRVTHAGKSELPWTVQEVLAWEPQKTRQAVPSWPDSGQQLVRTVEALKPARIYADAWPAALLRIELDYQPWITVTQAIDNTGAMVVPKGEWPVVEPGPGNAVVADAAEAPITEQALERWGVGFKKHKAGRYIIFELSGRNTGIPIKPAAVSAAVDSANAAALAEDGKQVVWSSQKPQNQGASLDIDLGTVQPVEWLELHNPNYYNDFPRGLAAWASDDGQNWQKIQIRLAGPLVFSGQIPLARSGPLNVYRLGNGLEARYIRLALDTSEAKWWWSVERLVLRGPAGQ